MPTYIVCVCVYDVYRAYLLYILYLDSGFYHYLYEKFFFLNYRLYHYFYFYFHFHFNFHIYTYRLNEYIWWPMFNQVKWIVMVKIFFLFCWMDQIWIWIRCVMLCDVIGTIRYDTIQFSIYNLPIKYWQYLFCMYVWVCVCVCPESVFHRFQSYSDYITTAKKKPKFFFLCLFELEIFFSFYFKQHQQRKKNIFMFQVNIIILKIFQFFLPCTIENILLCEFSKTLFPHHRHRHHHHHHH